MRIHTGTQSVGTGGSDADDGSNTTLHFVHPTQYLLHQKFKYLLQGSLVPISANLSSSQNYLQVCGPW